MQVFLAGIHGKDSHQSRDKLEVFKTENKAYEWIREELEQIGREQTKEGIIYIKKAYNSNFWQVINRIDKSDIPLNIGYGFMFIKELK